MKLKSLLFAMALAVCVPLAAQEQEAPPQEAPEQEAPPVDEAFIELKNVVDALAKLKISGYLQGQYVNDDANSMVARALSSNGSALTIPALQRPTSRVAAAALRLALRAGERGTDVRILKSRGGRPVTVSGVIHHDYAG